MGHGPEFGLVHAAGAGSDEAVAAGGLEVDKKMAFEFLTPLTCYRRAMLL